MRIRVAMLALAVGTFACSGAEGNDAAATQETQIVQVAVEGMQYTFSPATVEAGEPVRLVFDAGNLPGCSRSVTLPDYDITKTIEEGDATIEFTPRAEGLIAVVCTMKMYTGTLVAE